LGEIIIENLNKTFPGRSSEKTKVISNLSLHVKQGQTVSLLGPSGCGKTTTLRSIAGLEIPDSGKISIGSKTVFDKGVWVPPHRRNIGMVFQSYALWPHLSVFDNVAYPLRQQKVKKDEIKRRVNEVLDVVGIGHLHNRNPGQLSGGQQQRVALARSIVSEPDVILFDEPLSNLDAKLRKQMRIELSELQERVKFTSVYVTHDRIEALNISDYIAVMAGGCILQYGTPNEIYTNPDHPFVADFIGEYNLLTAVKEIRSNVVETSFGTLQYGCVKDVKDPTNVFNYADFVIAIPPDVVEIGTFSKYEPNCFEGIIRHITFLGTSVEYIVQIGDQKINVMTTRDQQHYHQGEHVLVKLPPEEIVLYRYSKAAEITADAEAAVAL
jgi:iron(III) transport system ATP-binding protein